MRVKLFCGHAHLSAPKLSYLCCFALSHDCLALSGLLIPVKTRGWVAVSDCIFIDDWVRSFRCCTSSFGGSLNITCFESWHPPKHLAESKRTKNWFLKVSTHVLSFSPVKFGFSRKTPDEIHFGIYGILITGLSYKNHKPFSTVDPRGRKGSETPQGILNGILLLSGCIWGLLTKTEGRGKKG